MNRPWLERCKLIVCAGSGGVGKTTTAAAIGCLMAARGKKVLVLTIDPAKRLAQALGINHLNSETKIKEPGFDGELWVSMIDSEKVFREFLGRFGDSVMIEKIMKNSLYKQLSTTLSGSQEFTSIIKLHEAVFSGRFDLVILDTPPAAHAIDFLSAPEKITALFNHRITKWFTPGAAQTDDIISRIINRGTRSIIGLFQKITGATFAQDLADFFEQMRTIQDKVSLRSQEAQDLLLSDHCAFVLVTSFDAAKLMEAKDFYLTLRQRGHHLEEVIVNRALPEWFIKMSEHDRKQQAQAMPKELSGFFVKYCDYLLAKNQVYDQFKEVPVIRIPDFNRPVHGVAGLIELAGWISRGGTP